MSIEAVARVLRRCPLQGTAKLVLLGIANHDGDGGAFPSVDTLATYASVNRRNAQRAIDALVADGWIDVHVGGGRIGRADRRTNLYVIRWDRFEHGVALPPPRQDASRDGGPDANGAARPTPRGGASDVDGVAVAPPEPSCEPSREPTVNRAAPAAASTELVLVGAPSGRAVEKREQLDEAFEAFWQAYPRKVGKPAAAKAWKAAGKRGAAPSAILAGLAAHRPSMVERIEAGEESFVPHPSTWLNQARYDDPPPVSSAVAASPRTAGVLAGMARAIASIDGGQR